MCIAIANFKNKPLTDEELKNCWANNSDGAGILYKKDDKLRIYKQMKSVDRFIRKYRQVITESNCILHFRIQTAGGVNVKNCHPFFINSKLGFAHNGIISGWGSKVVGQSDTYSYNEMVLKQLPTDFLNNEAIRRLIVEDIGSANKFIFMDHDENFTIMNASKGSFDEEGNWFSNDSHKRVNNFVYAGNQRVYKSPNTMYGGYSGNTSSFKTQWERCIESGKIIEQEDGTFLTDKGSRVKKTNTYPFTGYYWSSEYGAYLMTQYEEDRINRIEGKTKKEEPIEFKREDIESLDDTQFPDDDKDHADEEWWKRQIQNQGEGSTYEEEITDILDQVDFDVLDEVTGWTYINKVGATLVKYTDIEAGTCMSMTANVALNLIKNKYNKSEKTIAAMIEDYIEVGI